MKQKKIYDREFKEHAVKLSYQRDDVKSLAIELGITSKLFYSWRSAYRTKGSESFPGRGNVGVSPEAKQLVHLKKELERLQKENEILKKALSIISKIDI